MRMGKRESEREELTDGTTCAFKFVTNPLISTTDRIWDRTVREWVVVAEVDRKTGRFVIADVDEIETDG